MPPEPSSTRTSCCSADQQGEHAPEPSSREHQSQSAVPNDSLGKPTLVDKARIRFRKAGALRFLSHHDLLRTFERMLRRANLPFHQTQGFNPHPRLIFALSLPLGVVGQEEVVELELTQQVEPSEIHTRLTSQAPAGLEILSVRRMATNVSARVRRLCYRLRVPAEQAHDLAEQARAIMQQSECWVQRRKPAHGKDRPINLRPFLSDLRVFAEETEECPGQQNWTEPGRSTSSLEFELWLTPEGTARPEEVLRLFGLQDRLHSEILERTRLELADEPVPETKANQEENR